ncbi:MAG TPA: DUF1189 family protein [Pseudogracilibacillus sp.]|nr:DUF1189 family protein [Pseudogracilibacillus sp.]
MAFWTSFIESIKLPKKKSVFKLNRIGMDIVVIYMFMLLAIVSLPSLTYQMLNSSELNIKIGSFFYLIYFFIFHYLVIVVLIFIVISFIAYLATLFTRISGRRLHYSILWKMTAFSTTIPFLLYTILAFFYNINDNFLWLSFLYTAILLYKIITIYPKRKK